MWHGKLVWFHKIKGRTTDDAFQDQLFGFFCTREELLFVWTCTIHMNRETGDTYIHKVSLRTFQRYQAAEKHHLNCLNHWCLKLYSNNFSLSQDVFFFLKLQIQEDKIWVSSYIQLKAKSHSLNTKCSISGFVKQKWYLGPPFWLHQGIIVWNCTWALQSNTPHYTISSQCLHFYLQMRPPARRHC